jgi:diacylglycerol kinase (ATP)
MKRCKLFHNPGAGDEDHSKKELLSMIESKGFVCSYASVKEKGWEQIEPGVEFLVIAGGDGTVRRVANMLMKRKLVEGNPPLALLPLGTANNVAAALDLSQDTETLIKSWHKNKRKKFDIGRIYGCKDSDFFLESFGYGLFPYLIKEMQKNKPKPGQTPEEGMQASLKKLHELIDIYKPRRCNLEVDGVDHSGNYFLAEVLNTKSIGPNLFLAPNSDPGDGQFDVIVVKEKDKEEFAEYVQQKINGKEGNFPFESIKGKLIVMSWDGTHVHADDEVVEIQKKSEIGIEMRPGLLEFLIP